MNILIVEDIAASDFGGAERTMRKFCEFLKNEGHNLYLVYDRPGDYAEELNSIYEKTYNLSTHSFRHIGLMGWFSSLWRLISLCRSENIDLILTHVVHAAPILRLVKLFCGCRFIMHLKWICTSPDVGMQVKWGMRGVDASIAVSRFIADYWLRNGCEPQRISVVYEGLERIPLKKKKVSSCGKAALNLGFAGRIVEEKGLHVLLESVDELVNIHNLDVKLHVLGHFNSVGGEKSLYHMRIKQFITKNGLDSFVIFEGFIPDAKEFFRGLDIIIVPSLCAEACNSVVLEAMSVGVPVICTNSGGTPEIISDSMAAFLVNPNDSLEISEKVLMYLKKSSNEKQFIIDEAQAHVAKNFDLSRTHKQLAKICVGEKYD